MASGRKWFFILVALVFVVGFLSGIIMSPMIMRATFSHSMGMKHDMGPGGFGMGMERPDDHRRPPDGMGRGGPGGDEPEGHGLGRNDNMIKNHVIDEMSRELSLTDAQKKQLKKIFDENEPDQLAFRKQMMKQIEIFRKKMDPQILQILNDKQKKKFTEMTKRFNPPIDK
jgi:hypothetical protein